MATIYHRRHNTQHQRNQLQQQINSAPFDPSASDHQLQQQFGDYYDDDDDDAAAANERWLESDGGSRLAEQKLIHRLLTNYDTDARGVNASANETIRVEIELLLLRIQGLVSLDRLTSLLLLPLDEATTSRAVFVVASGSDGRKCFWSKISN